MVVNRITTMGGRAGGGAGAGRGAGGSAPTAAQTDRQFSQFMSSQKGKTGSYRFLGSKDFQGNTYYGIQAKTNGASKSVIFNATSQAQANKIMSSLKKGGWGRTTEAILDF